MASKLQAREEGGEEGESEELNVDKEKPVENLAADPGDGASSLLEACTLSPGPEAPLVCV